MAANMKAVKLRIKSMQSTMQTTKAMGLVASSKLRRAKERAENSRPYFNVLKATLTDIANNNTNFQSPYTQKSESDRWCYIVIAGDRGLAGGYNTNVFKELTSLAEGKDFDVLPIGKKTVEYFKRRRVGIVTEAFAEVASVSISDCFEIARMLCKAYCSGEYGHIAVCYTKFISMLSQKPGDTSLLPFEDFSSLPEGEMPSGDILYEPNGKEVFDTIVPEYLAGLIYGTVCESVASELAARRNAMDSATKNAEEMIEQLNLYYNRARQASITQEITEIVAGAEQP